MHGYGYFALCTRLYPSIAAYCLVMRTMHCRIQIDDQSELVRRHTRWWPSLYSHSLHLHDSFSHLLIICGYDLMQKFKFSFAGTKQRWIQRRNQGRFYFLLQVNFRHGQ